MESETLGNNLLDMPCVPHPDLLDPHRCHRPSHQMERDAPFKAAIAQTHGCLSSRQLLSLHLSPPARTLIQLVLQKLRGLGLWQLPLRVLPEQNYRPYQLLLRIHRIYSV